MSSVFSLVEALKGKRQRFQSELTHASIYQVYGYPVHLAANHEALLGVPPLSAACFSRCPAMPAELCIRIELLRESDSPSVPMPLDLAARVEKQALEQFRVLSAPPWASAFADLSTWEIVAALSPAVAQQPDWISRYISDYFCLHLLMRARPPGLTGHLHASTVFRDGRALLLVGRHNSGKSTTALRLMLGGWRLLTDSNTFVRWWDRGAELLGYCIGQLRLRADVLELFPTLQGRGQTVHIGGETKTAINLRQDMPACLLEDSIWPQETVVCHVLRTSSAETSVRPVNDEEMLERIWPEAAFADDPEINDGIRVAVARLLSQSRCCQLFLGENPDRVVEAIEAL